jgi:hypothetical protein
MTRAHAHEREEPVVADAAGSLIFEAKKTGPDAELDRLVIELDATRAAATVILGELEGLGEAIPLPVRTELTRRVRQRISVAEGHALQGLVDASPVRGILSARAALEAKAVQAVLNGTEWMTALEVGLQQNPDATNPHAVTSRWKKEGKVFSIERVGQALYPKYIFDQLGNPIPEVAKVLKIFDGYRPFRIASWFESTNSLLHRKRPREVLALDPAAVVEAARDHVVGAVHG